LINLKQKKRRAKAIQKNTESQSAVRWVL